MLALKVKLKRFYLSLRHGRDGFSLVEVAVAGALLGFSAYYIQSHRGTKRVQEQRKDFFLHMLNIKTFMVKQFSLQGSFFPPLHQQVYYICFGAGAVELKNSHDEHGFATTPVEGVHTLYRCMDGRRQGSSSGGGSGGGSGSQPACMMPSVADIRICPDARYVGFLEPQVHGYSQFMHLQVIAFNTGTGEAVQRLRSSMPSSLGY